MIAGAVPDCVVFSDELNHASIIDGLRHSGAAKRIFRHNDAAHLEELIAAEDPERPKLIVLESVYSMSGDVAPIREVTEVARKYGATIFLDEVHAVGMYGPRGAGIAAREGLAEEIDVVMGTLGKGFGTAGGYIAGPAALIDAVRTLSRPFVFTVYKRQPPSRRRSRRARWPPYATWRARTPSGPRCTATRSCCTGCCGSAASRSCRTSRTSCRC